MTLNYVLYIKTRIVHKDNANIPHCSMYKYVCIHAEVGRVLTGIKSFVWAHPKANSMEVCLIRSGPVGIY